MASDRLRTALGGLRVTPPIPPGRMPRANCFEEDEPELKRDQSASWTAFIRYVDAAGEESQRRFTCHAIQGFAGAVHITGFCHERSAIRTFRIDRIAELVCAETGEELDPVAHFELLRETGALKVQDKVFTEVGRLLVFLAKCDGQFHPLERTALEDHLSRYCMRFNGTDRMAEDAISGSRFLAPDSDDMVTALRRLARAPDGSRVARFVLDCGADVIDADGRHAPEEMAWAIEMSDALKGIADRR